jgi:predicted Zn finger-like uncharacterized protein
MKFNCDRCKTRYSISDDRVVGKILKIRCKNCSAVITVREGMSVVSPRIPEPAPSPGSGPTLAPTPPPPPKAPPPPPPVTEWYVSIDGRQSGPFDLAAAKRWVAARPANDELYCWSEGFDDWLPTDKVSHFRGLRPTNGASGMLSVADPDERTPAPLFAETMKQMAAEAPTLLEDENPFSAAYERKKRATAEPAVAQSPAPSPADSGALDFRIGEADRVFKQPGTGMPPIGSDEELPRISGLTVPQVEMPRPEVLQPSRRSPLVIPLIAASVILLLVLGVLIYLALRGGGDDGSSEVRRAPSRSGSIAAGFDDDRAPRVAEAEPAAAPVDAGARAPSTRDRTPSSERGARGDDGETRTAGYTPPPGEVDLSGVGGDDAPIRAGSLQPSDISGVYLAKQFAVNRCFENAIKRDPLLRVPKTIVTLEIAGSGRVTRVSIPSFAGKPLGKCLVASIGRWTFPRSTEGFNGSFPIVFRAR